MYKRQVLVKGADVIHFLQRDHTQVFHTDFLSLIDEWKPLQHEIQGSQHFFTGITAVALRDVVADAAGFVMIFNDV